MAHDHGSDLSRRTFVQLAGLTALGGTAVGRSSGFGAFAGPFSDDFPIPADKKFDPAWVASLRARGTPAVASSLRDELRFIGMPVGGLCCGQVYLGGDGQLWHWDILNLPQAREWTDSSGPQYAKPAVPKAPFEQGFDLLWGAAQPAGQPTTASLNAKGFRDIEFRGEYPVGRARFRDASCPLEVSMEAFSPFCPLDTDESSLPAVIVRYTVKNTGKEDAGFQLQGRLQNPACLGTGRPGDVRLFEAPCIAPGLGVLLGAGPVPEEQTKPRRPDLVFEDWEKGTYEGWTATGQAFGETPRKLSDIAPYQGDLNAQGRWTVNTHESRHGEDVVKADTYLGTLTSREFTVERDWIRFRIGGGNHPDQTCINLLVDGKVVRTATGHNSNRMRVDHWDVRELAGKKASIRIVDDFAGGWGQIGIDEIVFTDSDRLGDYDLSAAPDFGTMAMVSAAAWKSGGDGKPPPAVWYEHGSKRTSRITSGPWAVLKPGESAEHVFVLAWHFPNPPRDQLGFITGIAKLRHHYAARFKDAGAVASYILADLDRLTAVTRLWRDTWYDSTLPHWFLDRTFATVSTAATTTCYRFDNGRFYGWEGTYCCAGTCTHVWQYAQALARTFPSLERSLREKIDFGQEFNAKTGLIHYRGEAARELAIDGQCGTIIRAWREHTMCGDDAFLKAVYPNVRKAMELVIARDEGRDGILDGPQYNTLDTTWYGQISWITSLYIAALRASAALAADAGDAEFAALCTRIADQGATNIAERLFNGEYFVHKLDPKFPGANAIGDGCHSDQILGQSMALQNGLPRVVPAEHALKALRAVFTYCLAPDCGAYRAFAEKTVKGGRWYAMPGEGGLVMCTWPKGGSHAAMGKSDDAWAAGYFNECWTGYEGQVASHMIAEGLVHEGLAVVRMYHDRHHPAKRNPYNEVECSSHYARAMSGYGSFISACGFTHHGPRGMLRFAPAVLDPAAPDRFKAAFIAAQGWGTYEQPGPRDRRLAVRWGSLTLRELRVPAPNPAPTPAGISVTLDAVPVDHRATVSTADDGRAEAVLRFDPPLTIRAGRTLAVAFS